MALNISIIKKEQNDIIFNSNTSIIKQVYKDHIEFCEYKKEIDNVNFNFCSTNKKVVIRIFPSFYHFYTEAFATLLFVYSYHKDIEVLIVDLDETIDISKILDIHVLEKLNAFKKARDMFFLFLNDNNIKYKTLDIKDINNSIIDNYFYCDTLWDDSRNQAALLSEMSSKYVKVSNNKKRAYIKTRRVKNEPALIKYFTNLGFDIIENNTFDNFIDQMNYYKNTELLVSATSAGLVNLCFMNDRSTVIELVTTIPTYSNEEIIEEQVHHIYDTLSLQKNHTYISISNIDKTAEDIIEHIKNNKLLRLILEKNE